MIHRATLAAAALALTATAAHARPEYPTYVPTPYDCETCHLDPNDRLNRNGFGIDFALQRGQWVNAADPNQGLCFLDSDFDGLTNGEELNDPNCWWRRGDPRPGGRTTHPGDPSDPDQCGDGELQPWEACDGALFTADCVELGYVGGEVRCYSDCTIDERRCELPPPPDRGVERDMAVEDAGVEEPDAMGAIDAMVETMDAMGAMPDAMPDAMDGIDAGPSTDADGFTLDAEPLDAAPVDAGGGSLDMVPLADFGDGDGGCSARPGRAGGAAVLALLALIALRRRRG